MSDLVLVSETFEADLSGNARARLRALSDRVPHVPAERDPYRLAMNRLGLDAPTPAEAAFKDRLVWGGYRSRGLLADALLIAVVETGAGVWAASGPVRLEGAEVVGEGWRVPVFSAPPPVVGPCVTVFGFAVPAVGEGVVREALWIVREVLTA